MKKIIFIISLVIFLFICNSKPVFSVDFSLGLKAGACMPFYSGNDYKAHMDYWENWLKANSVPTDDFTMGTQFQAGFSGGLFFKLNFEDPDLHAFLSKKYHS